MLEAECAEPSTWMCTARRDEDLPEKESVVVSTIWVEDSRMGVESCRRAMLEMGEVGAAMVGGASGVAAIGVGGARMGVSVGEMVMSMGAGGSGLNATDVVSGGDGVEGGEGYIEACCSVVSTGAASGVGADVSVVTPPSLPWGTEDGTEDQLALSALSDWRVPVCAKTRTVECTLPGWSTEIE